MLHDAANILNQGFMQSQRPSLSFKMTLEFISKTSLSLYIYLLIISLLILVLLSTLVTSDSNQKTTGTRLVLNSEFFYGSSIIQRYMTFLEGQV